MSGSSLKYLSTPEARTHLLELSGYNRTLSSANFPFQAMRVEDSLQSLP